MTTIFAFDTATSAATCALVRDGELRRRAARRGDGSVLARPTSSCAAAGIDAARASTRSSSAPGPGSFTSIRIGLATARGLALALDVPVAGVSTLHAFAGGQPVIDARRGEVFTDGPTVVRPEELDVAGTAGSSATAPCATATLFEAAGAEVPPDDDPAHLPSRAPARRARRGLRPADARRARSTSAPPTRGRAR